MFNTSMFILAHEVKNLFYYKVEVKTDIICYILTSLVSL